jgi:hypothetical protein
MGFTNDQNKTAAIFLQALRLMLFLIDFPELISQSGTPACPNKLCLF